MEQEARRVRRPKEGEMLGIAIAMLGASRLTAECEDGKTRMVRIRGKLRKRIWVRVGDLVVLVPWKTEPDEKADMVWRYTKTEANFLKKKGYGKNLDF